MKCFVNTVASIVLYIKTISLICLAHNIQFWTKEEDRLIN
jgi:hypothetical protein